MRVQVWGSDRARQEAQQEGVDDGAATVRHFLLQRRDNRSSALSGSNRGQYHARRSGADEARCIVRQHQPG